MEESKEILIDLTKNNPKEISKSLLDDFSLLAEKLKSDTIYAALSASSASFGVLARNLLVYGFEKTSLEEASKYTSSPDIVLLKKEVDQEDDFVDLY